MVRLKFDYCMAHSRADMLFLKLRISMKGLKFHEVFVLLVLLYSLYQYKSVLKAVLVPVQPFMIIHQFIRV